MLRVIINSVRRYMLMLSKWVRPEYNASWCTYLVEQRRRGELEESPQLKNARKTAMEAIKYQKQTQKKKVAKFPRKIAK